MLRKFNPILDEDPTVFVEDVYVVTRTGKVLASRQGTKRKIDNFLALMGRSEREFVRKNALMSAFYPLLLVRSSQGLMLLDFSLFISKKMFVAVIPRISEEKLLSACKSQFSSIVYPSPALKERLETAEVLEFDEDQEAFCKNLGALCRANRLYRVHGLTNVELNDLITDVAIDICNFVGCRIDFDVRGIGIFEMKNELCLDSLRCMLISVGFAVRDLSADRRGQGTIIFDEMGIILRIGFEISDEYKGVDLTSFSPILDHLKNHLVTDAISCTFEIENDALYVNGLLWNMQGDFEHVKKDVVGIKYNNED